MSTITEALAELKTLDKRLSTKRDFVRNYMFRLDNLKDPFEKDGGSQEKVAAELQSMSDLEARAVSLRRAIQSANEKTILSLHGTEMSIADWLVWRREVAPNQKMFLQEMSRRLIQARETINRQQAGVTDAAKVQMIVNIDESKLNKDLEKIELILGDLDGQLSLKNATVMI